MIAGAISGLPNGLIKLNLNKTSLNSKSVIAILKAIEGHNSTLGSLLSLGLNNCKLGIFLPRKYPELFHFFDFSLEGVFSGVCDWCLFIDLDGCKALGLVLSKCSNLVDLDVSFTGADFHVLKKCETLTSLEISGNKIVTKDAKHLDLIQFLKYSPKIVDLNLSNTSKLI